MAIVRGSISRALLKYPDLDLGSTRLIGWGAGQAFRDYYPYVNLPLEYTICPITGHQGASIHGVSVRPPDALLAEPRDKVLIVVMAAHYALIMHQISHQFGDIRVVNGWELSPNRVEIDEVCELNSLLSGLAFTKRSSEIERLGIFTQGPIFDYTPLALAQNRLQHPTAYHCLVTWDHQPNHLLEKCAPWVDRIITLPQPENLGNGHSNAILRSARAGAECMAERGVRYAVRCRSDAVIIGSVNKAISRMFGDGGKNKGKIGICLGASLKHIPFHFSDKYMIARTEDMLELWSLDEDPRTQAEVSATVRDSDHFLNLHKGCWESRLWSSFAAKRGFATNDLSDSYRFAHSSLVPLEPDASMLSLKHLPMFNIQLDKGYQIDTEWWSNMQDDIDGTVEHAKLISNLNVTVSEYWRSKVG
jgi:hypothetical protein